MALSILLDSNDVTRNRNLSYARDVLRYFVRYAPDIYGETFCTYNVHSLLHIPDDVHHFSSSLNEISAFKYENYLFKLKKCVRKSQNPISQIAKRLTETEKNCCRQTPKSVHIHVTTSTKRKDCCFLLKNGKFSFMIERRTDKNFLCDVIGQDQLESFIENPCQSMFIDIRIVQNPEGLAWRMVIEMENVDKKAVCLPYERGYLLIPMRHEMERW